MKKIIIITLALVMLGIGASGYAATAPATKAKAKAVVSKIYNDKEIVKVAMEFVRDYLVDGAKVDVKVKSKVGNVFDLAIKIDGGTEINSAISADGKFFYPTVINIADYKDKNLAVNQTGPAKVAPSVTKSDKPLVELFVMSHCPYGTQMEKGIIPAVEALGDKIDFQLKFVDYAMHGDKEIKEQMNQYCIGQLQRAKLLPYLKCFLNSGDGTACLTETGISPLQLKLCVNNTDAKFKITDSFNNKAGWNSSFPPFAIYQAENTKYGVQGSPTLVINGQEVSTGRDSNSLFQVICAGFNKAPAICQTAKLSSVSPAPGFGQGTATTNNSEAQCN